MLVRPVTFLILVSVCFMIALGMISLLSGSRPARFYVIAWGAFLCGSVVFLLKNFGLVPHTFVTQHSWQVGALRRNDPAVDDALQPHERAASTRAAPIR